MVSFPVVCLLSALSTIRLVDAVIGPEKGDWNRDAYIVKVYTRDKEIDVVKTCSGTLISGSLVLTSIDCVTHKEAKLTEVVVSVRRVAASGVDSYPAVILETFGDLALLRIKRIDVRALCPRTKSASKRVLRLPLRLSLTESSIIQVSIDDVKKSKCHLLGIRSNQDVKQFASELTTIKIPIEVSNFDGEAITAPAQANQTACYEDAGLPLICDLPNLGPTQVGMLRQLIVGDDVSVTPTPTAGAARKRRQEEKGKTSALPTTTVTTKGTSTQTTSLPTIKKSQLLTKESAVDEKPSERTAERSEEKKSKIEKEDKGAKRDEKHDETKDEDEEDEKGSTERLLGRMCKNVREMVFAPLLRLDTLAGLIVKYDLASLADVYHHCDFA